MIDEQQIVGCDVRAEQRPLGAGERTDEGRTPRDAADFQATDRRGLVVGVLQESIAVYRGWRAAKPLEAQQFGARGGKDVRFLDQWVVVDKLDAAHGDQRRLARETTDEADLGIGRDRGAACRRIGRDALVRIALRRIYAVQDRQCRLEVIGVVKPKLPCHGVDRLEPNAVPERLDERETVLDRRPIQTIDVDGVEVAVSQTAGN